MTVSPFTIAVPDAEIALLRERLRATRFPDVAPNADFARGTSGEYLRELVAYWAGEFDWREAEAGLNAIPQFVAEV
ncbi:epoxide hydrolase N-terminal domain-containing protein, partial [Mycobacterium kansasii]